MSNGIVMRFFGTLLLNFIIFSNLYSQDHSIGSVRVMFYNVENLFDIYDDSLTADNDFLPEGLMRWNYTRYTNKINSIYKTVMAAGDWDPPAIIGLCEIENRKVLKDLINKTNLYRYNYQIIHEDSPDERGIDVALIYRSDIVKILFSKYFSAVGEEDQIITTRNVLYAKYLINNDTLHIFINHWPSRRGGVLAGEDNRIIIADLINTKIDSIFQKDPSGAKIIITGDFNCTPDDHVIKLLMHNQSNVFSLKNLADSISSNGSGSYRYSGTWELLDQCIVSDYLFNAGTGLYVDSRSFRIFKPEFLLMKDPGYPGTRPFSTYRGYRYQGGFSDHLPVLVDLVFR